MSCFSLLFGCWGSGVCFGGVSFVCVVVWVFRFSFCFFLANDTLLETINCQISLSFLNSVLPLLPVYQHVHY